MNLPEYVSKVFDEREWLYDKIIKISDLTTPHGARESGEAVMRIREIKAHRKIVARHNTWRGRYPDDPDVPSQAKDCVGCGWDIVGHPITWDINKCPDLLALVEPYSDRADFDTWS